MSAANDKPALFIVGFGPGIARSVAERFLSAGFSLGLISRSTASHEQLVASRATDPSKDTIQSATADVSNYAELKQALERLKERLGSPSVVLYNAGSFVLGTKKIEESTPEDIEKHLSISTVAGFVTAQWAAQNLQPRGSAKKPALFFTGGGLARNPWADYAGLGMGKAALLNLARNYKNNILGPKGIHVATVTVCGLVNPDDPKYSPALIADKFWKLYTEQGPDPSNWTEEVVY